MSCPASQYNQTVSPRPQGAQPVQGYQERIGWQPYTKRIDPYSAPADSYATVNGAFAKSEPMIEFQKKLATNNPIYLQVPDDQSKQSDLLASPQAINQNLKNLINSPTSGPSSGPSFKPDVEIERIANSLYTPTPSYPLEYPLYRTAYYDPRELDSELLEGFSIVDNIEYTTGMGFPQFLLWLILIVLVIYAIYYFTTNYSTSPTNAVACPTAQQL
jgi:hypothetical protein